MQVASTSRQLLAWGCFEGQDISSQSLSKWIAQCIVLRLPLVTALPLLPVKDCCWSCYLQWIQKSANLTYEPFYVNLWELYTHMGVNLILVLKKQYLNPSISDMTDTSHLHHPGSWRTHASKVQCDPLCQYLKREGHLYILK